MTVVALAVDPKFQKSICLIKITEEEKKKTEVVGANFGHVIKKKS